MEQVNKCSHRKQTCQGGFDEQTLGAAAVDIGAWGGRAAGGLLTGLITGNKERRLCAGARPLHVPRRAFHSLITV